jgi:hypothetical protein
MNLRHASCSAIVLLALALGGTADALPQVGAPRAAARVIDANDRTLDLGGIRNKPMLVVYEDKDSAAMNTALKEQLALLARGDRYRTAVALVPVADVEGYDYWPVRGFVKSSIRGESKKIGATIYCDWDGSFRRAMGLRRGTSNIVLFGRDARVLFASEGPLGKTDRDRLVALLRSQVDLTPGS